MFYGEPNRVDAFRQECDVYSQESKAAMHSVRSAMFIATALRGDVLRQECNVYSQEPNVAPLRHVLYCAKQRITPDG